MSDTTTRRAFMSRLGAGLAGAAASHGHAYADDRQRGDARGKPNIVFIMTDQQRWDTLGCLGLEHAVTPNIDQLAAVGTCFTHHFVQSAVCCPSRASLVSGKYTHCHGVLSNGMWLLPGEPNWIEDLRDAGYHTANIGKMHTRPVRLPCGFDYRFVVENKNHREDANYGHDDYELFLRALGHDRPGSHYSESLDDWHENLNSPIWPLDEELYPDNLIGRMSVDYIRDHDFNGRPLFLWSGFVGPHDPYDITRTALERYPDVPIPDPVTFPGELETKPPEQRKYMEDMDGSSNPDSVWWRYATPENIRRLRRHYYANIMLIDEWVGSIVDALRERGQLDNTIFVFTSDHGDALADHGLIYKFASHYDPVVRVPLVMAGPGIPARGLFDPLVELIDVGPTLLDTVGVQWRGRRHGVSLTPLLKGETDSLHDAVFSEFGTRNMVRTADWKLVMNAGRPEGELYDLRADPDELRNLFDASAHADVRNELTARLADWFATTKFSVRNVRRVRG